MLKRLSLLCVAVMALVACHGSLQDDSSSTPAAAATAATAATAPAPASTAVASGSTAVPAASASAVADDGEDAAVVGSGKPPAPFVDAGKWKEGTNYFVIDPAVPTNHPGKVEVTEVFSYACPACNQFHTTMDALVKSMPNDVIVTYVAAAFRPDENWPLFQRAFYAAQALGVADKTYDAMFDAAWKTGELATYDLQAGKPKPKEAWPTLNDVAKFYAKYGVNPQTFIGVANSFSINLQMKRADDMLKAYQVDSTPTLVVNGKYRLTPISAGGLPQTIELTQWLVSKEAAGK